MDKHQIPHIKDVIIIGGSLSALMHGIVLRRLGCSVLILERSPTEAPPSHMAGICLGADVLRLLDRFDRVDKVQLGLPSVQLQSLDNHGKAQPFLKASRVMSSWDAVYFRLRANFDFFASDYVLYPPAPEPMIGEDVLIAKSRAKYEVGKEVVDVKKSHTGRMLVTYKDYSNGCHEVNCEADLVLGADGPNSIVRKIFLGAAQVDRKYSGYVAWRGTVPEDQVSDKTREIFSANITYSILGGEAGHVILYNIPGTSGSIEPGKRMLNFCWYMNVPASKLDSIMTDVEGIRHQTQLPPGTVQSQVWDEQKAYARTIFAPPYLEVIDKIDSPFLHLITDYCAPRMAFADGKVLLVGDAAALLRPHIAFSTNQAAYQALLTEQLVKGEISTEQWEYQVTSAAHLHWRRSVWFGEFFQRPLYVSFVSAVQYWLLSGIVKVKIWLGWLPKQFV